MMQPYAWLVANGFLSIDDRTWPTSYRGALAIHASKKFHEAYYSFLTEHTNWPLPNPSDFEQGGVVGVARLANCIAPTLPAGSPMPRLELRRSHFGAPGHYGFVLEEPRTISFVPFRGNQGLFNIPDAVLAGQ